MAASSIKVESSSAAAAVDVATKTVSDVHYQKMQMVVGDDTEAVVVNNGQQTKANSVPVVIASDQFGRLTAAGSLSVVLASDHANVPISSGVKTSGTALTLTGSSSSTPVDLDVTNFDEVTIYWDITANSGSWQMVIQGYSPTESNEVDLMSSPPMTTTGCVALTLNTKTLLKLKISHIRSTGTITSTTQYCGK